MTQRSDPASLFDALSPLLASLYDNLAVELRTVCRITDAGHVLVDIGSTLSTLITRRRLPMTDIYREIFAIIPHACQVSCSM